jgi:hypothetical protein
LGRCAGGRKKEYIDSGGGNTCTPDGKKVVRTSERWKDGVLRWFRDVRGENIGRIRLGKTEINDCRILWTKRREERLE